jgi:hypothetical protein
MKTDSKNNSVITIHQVTSWLNSTQIYKDYYVPDHQKNDTSFSLSQNDFNLQLEHPQSKEAEFQT